MSNNNQNTGSFVRARARTPPPGAYSPYPAQHPGAHSGPVYHHPQNWVWPAPGPHVLQPMVPNGFQYPAHSGMRPVEAPVAYNRNISGASQRVNLSGVSAQGYQYDSVEAQHAFAHHANLLPAFQLQLPATTQPVHQGYWPPTPLQQEQRWHMPSATAHTSHAPAPPPLRIVSPDMQYQTTDIFSTGPFDNSFNFGNTLRTKTPNHGPTPLLNVFPVGNEEQYLGVPSSRNTPSPVDSPIELGSMFSSPASSNHGSAFSLDLTDDGSSADGMLTGLFVANFDPAPIFSPHATITPLPASTPDASAPDSSSSSWPQPSLAESTAPPSKNRKPRKKRASDPLSPNRGNRTPVFRSEEQWAEAHLDHSGKWIEPRVATKQEIMTVKASRRKREGEMFVCACGLVATSRTIKEDHMKYHEPKVCDEGSCRKKIKGWMARHKCERHNVHDECDPVISKKRCAKSRETWAKREREQAGAEA
ncbi:unnamed protein product [Peniophora sp. CBMAI 1063]|nr:unnamed protein product [Peniophora sp. CBMAI 1063]